MSDIRQWSVWLRIENLAIFLVAVLAYHYGNYEWWLFAVLFLIPDLSILGYLAGRNAGAFVYNAGHTYLGPAMLVVVALILDDQRPIPFAIIWVAHIAVDRLLGFGLKSFSGFKHTHLGYVGKKTIVQDSN